MIYLTPPKKSEFPKEQAFGSVVWLYFILVRWLPTCKNGRINIYHVPPNKVSKAWCCQPVLWLPEPSGDCLPHPLWKSPLFSSEIYESSSVPFFSSNPLWSHSPLVDCLPNGHWQMMLKIAGLAPLLQTATEVGQWCCFPMPYSVWSELFNIALSYLYTSPVSVSLLCLSFCLNRSWWMLTGASHKGFLLHKGCAAEWCKNPDFLWCALT